MNGSGAYRCGGLRWLEGAPSALPGALLFAAGLAGNVLALGLLWHHHRRRRRRGGVVGGPRRVPAFQLLIGALAAADLLGKCVLSPVVLAAYARNRSLSALWPPAPEAPGGSAAAVEDGPPGGLCQLFACLMAFFGLAPSLLLLAMALDVWLSLGRPYCYQRHARRRRRLGAVLGGCAGALCALFCALPLLGVGAAVQYCPGTWCFLRMAGPGRAYALLYASLLGLLVLAVGLLNLATMRSLCRLARRQPPRGSRLGSARAPASAPSPAPARLEELGHLALLALMTVVFTVCSLPLIIRAYVGALAPDYDESADLTALRFFSVNSIVDPWVFIIFRTAVFRTCLHRVSRTLSYKRSLDSQLLETSTRKDSGQLQ